MTFHHNELSAFPATAKRQFSSIPPKQREKMHARACNSQEGGSCPRPLIIIRVGGGEVHRSPGEFFGPPNDARSRSSPTPCSRSRNLIEWKAVISRRGGGGTRDKTYRLTTDARPPLLISGERIGDWYASRVRTVEKGSSCSVGLLLRDPFRGGGNNFPDTADLEGTCFFRILGEC